MGFDLQQEWANVSGAPLIFFGTIIVVAGLIWVAISYLKKNEIEHLNERIRLRDDELAHYKQAASRHATSLPQGAPIAEPPMPITKPVKAPAALPAAAKGSAMSAVEFAARAERVFVGDNVTPAYLMELCVGRTTVHAKRSTEVFRGKWICVTGKVKNISDSSETHVLVAIDAPVSFRPNTNSTLWMSFRQDRERLEVMHIDDEITAIGKIDRIKEFEIDLEDCELV